MHLIQSVIRLLALVALSGPVIVNAQKPTVPSAPTPLARNARDFLARLSAEGGGSSGGAGNGGNNLVSRFYRQALIGLQYLKLTRLLSESELVLIHDSILNSRVYPVDFQLCALDDDSSCSDEAAMSSKNYRERKIILVDARKLPRRFEAMTENEQRRHAIHEFAGLAGIELSNHHFTASFDSVDLYDKFTTKQQKKEYFAILGSLFQALPESLAQAYVGHWRKMTSLQRGRHLTVKGETDLIKGDAYAFDIQAVLNYSGRLDNGVDVISWDYRYNVNSGNFEYRQADYFHCGIGELGIQCGDDDYKPWRRTLKRHERKYPEIFAPLELKHRAEVYPLTCKVWSEDELLCRNFYYHWMPYMPVQTLLWMHEYAIYKRTSRPLSDFKFVREPRPVN